MADATNSATTDLNSLVLHDLHVELGAKMVPFAGYEMPVQFAAGVMKEHLHTRQAAGLFDVSHMGQVILRPKAGTEGNRIENVARAFEALMPVAVLGLPEGRQRYGLLTNDAGGILDDLMFANRGDHIFVVVNAACKTDDIAHMRAQMPGVVVQEITDRALLALQGPKAETVLTSLAPEAAQMRFMDVRTITLCGAEAWVSRSGYTGEDGYEISIPNSQAETLARALLDHPDTLPIGLGARDSLRLEAGLCLYGHDIDTTTSPVEAGLQWAIQKVRRAGGDREGGFPGATRILNELANGPARKRVGLSPQGRAPMREGVPLFADDTATNQIGAITSGAFGPTVQAPVSMGYVPIDKAGQGTIISAELRGKRAAVTVAPLPFTPANFKR